MTTEATEAAATTELRVTSYNEFLRHFYPDPQKAQLMSDKGSDKPEAASSCLSSR